MLRLLAVLVMAGVAGGGFWAYRHNTLGVRERVTHEVTQRLDGWLGAKTHVEPVKPLPKPTPNLPVVKAVKPPPGATPGDHPVLPAAPAAPIYVDRGPQPSAVERVKSADRERLNQLIAQRTAPLPVAQRDHGAKRHDL